METRQTFKLHRRRKKIINKFEYSSHKTRPRPRLLPLVHATQFSILQFYPEVNAQLMDTLRCFNKHANSLQNSYRFVLTKLEKADVNAIKVFYLSDIIPEDVCITFSDTLPAIASIRMYIFNVMNLCFWV